MGDSKTKAAGWGLTLWGVLDNPPDERWSFANAGQDGTTVASAAAAIATTLSNLPATEAPRADVLCNWGANDMGAMPDEATFKTNYLAILDAVHAKWAQATVRIMRPWRRNMDSRPATLAAWIADIVAARPTFAVLGPDERVWLEGGDDGATMTYDGIHYSAAGHAECAAQWQAAMGY